MPISVVINTYNAEQYLSQVLDSVKDFDEVLICDMESTDSTLAIAQRYNCKVVTFERGEYNIVEPARNFAIRNAKYEWVLVVDADEVVPAELREYLYRRIADPNCPEGIFVPRKNYFMNKFLPSSYPDYQLRFVKRDKCYWPETIHSRPKIDGKVVRVPAHKKNMAMVHLNKDLATTFVQLNEYTDNEVSRRKGKHVSFFNLLFEPTFHFFKYYVLKGGLFYGKIGFIHACKFAYYKYVVLSKLLEYEINRKMYIKSSDFSVGVIISTYNSPAWLEKVLWGYSCQSVKPDEIVIADDGSREDTRQLIERYAEVLPIKHVWHEDRGFQKSQILNKAIVASSADYLIFTDQDCIPRRDFVAVHKEYAELGYFLSGGYFKLPMDISLALTKEDIESQRAFSLKWLMKKGLKWTFKCTKLITKRWFTRTMNCVTPRGATWNGCNASGWRSDILKTNGFNEEMQYGGQDREFGERMFNMGIKSKQIVYSAICLHLDHKRPYKTKASIAKNVAIRKNTRKSGIVETPNGIVKK